MDENVRIENRPQVISLAPVRTCMTHPDAFLFSAEQLSDSSGGGSPAASSVSLQSGKQNRQPQECS